MQALLQDFRYTFRQLVKNPGFALTALLSPGIGNWRNHRRLQRGVRRSDESISI